MVADHSNPATDAAASSSTHSNSNSHEPHTDPPHLDHDGHDHDDDHDDHDPSDEDEDIVNSFRLQYPKSSRLLLGTTTNIQQPGFLKALETQYPLELSLECFDLVAPPRLLSRLSMRSRVDRHWALRPFAVFYYREGQHYINGQHHGHLHNAGSNDPHSQSHAGMVNGNAWERIGRTETILYDDYHRFVTKLKVRCSTSEERRKQLRVEVYDRRTKTHDTDEHNFIGAAECSMDDIISEPLLRKEMRLGSLRVVDPGRIVISADAIRPPCSGPAGPGTSSSGGGEALKIRLRVDLSPGSKGVHRAFFVMSRQLQSGHYTAVYRSEIIGRDVKMFKEVTRDVAAITAGVDDKLLRLELFQYNGRAKHTRLGFMQTSVDKLKRTAIGQPLLWWTCAYSEDADLIDVGRVVLVDKKRDDEELHFRLRITKAKVQA